MRTENRRGAATAIVLGAVIVGLIGLFLVRLTAWLAPDPMEGAPPEILDEPGFHRFVPTSPRRLMARVEVPSVTAVGGVPSDHPFANVHITGRVYTQSTQVGIEGATVRIKSVHGAKLGPAEGTGILAARTRTDGSYALRGVPPGTFELEADAPGYALARTRFEKWSEIEDDDGFDFGLVPARTLEGRVVGPDGAAVAAATVRAMTPGASPDELAPVSVTTDGLGRFILDRCNPTQTKVVATHPAMGNGGAAVPPLGGTDRLTITLSGQIVRGRVEGPSGAIEAASVSITLQHIGGRRVGALDEARTKTDGEGRYVLGLPRAGPAALLVEAAGHVARQRVIAAVERAPVHEVDVRLEPGTTFIGVVYRGDGQPAASAEVSIRQHRRWSSARTEANGGFTVDGVPPEGPYEVRIHHHDHPPFHTTEPHLVARHSYTLERPGTIAGRVLNAGTGAPITRFEYRLEGPIHRTQSGWSRSGSFELLRLVEGPYQLTVDAIGFLPRTESPIVVDAGGRVARIFRLDVAGGIAGRLVRLTSDGGGPIHVQVEDGEGAVVAEAGTEGMTFRVGELPPGVYRVVAFDEVRVGTVDGVTVELGEITTGLVIELTPQAGKQN